MKKFLSLVTGLSVVACGGALLVGCGEKKTPPPPPPAQPNFVVSENVKTKVAEAINVINNDVYNKLTGQKNYTVDGTEDEVEALTEAQYYVELGKVENVTDVQSIELGGVTYDAQAQVSVSVGNNNFIKDKAFTYSLGSLKIAAPVLAFELRPTMTIKVNGTTFNLTNVPALTVGNLEFQEVVTQVGSHNKVTPVADKTNEYDVTLKQSNSYFVAKLKAEDKADAVHFLTRSKVNNETRFGFTQVDEDGFGFYFNYKEDGSVDPALNGTTREMSVLHVNGETAKQANLKFNLSVVQGDTEFAKLIEDATDGVVTLPCDFELTNRVTITKNVTINLNGHTIKFAKNNDEPDSFGFVITNPGKLTINGEGTISSGYQKIFGIKDERALQGDIGEQRIALEINGGTFESANCEVLYVQRGRAIINGGSFKSTDTTYNKDGKNFTLNCFNKEAGVNSLIVVNGGSFYKFDPSNLKNDDRQGTYLDITTTTVEPGEEQDWFKVVPVKTIEVADYAALKEAVATANAGDTIKLTGDISTTENDVLEVNTTLTLDLDTHSISADNSQASADKKAYLFKVVAGGKLTVVGTTGSITSKNQIPLATGAEDAVLIVKGGNFINNAPEGANLNHETVYCLQGKIEILGGTFKTENKMTTDGKLFTINCSNAKYNEGKTSITITGGKFWKFDPASPNTDDASSYVPLGYATKEVETDWKEVDLADEISVSDEANLREALRVAKVGATIKLGAEITLTNKSYAFSVNKDLTLDLNGKTLNANAMVNTSTSSKRLFNIASGVHFTVKDSSNGTGKVTTNTVRIFWLHKNDVELTIEGGKFETADSVLVYVEKASKVVINGGSFKTSATSAQYLLNIYDSAVNASITVNGGEFKDFDPKTTNANDEGIKLGDNKKSAPTSDGHSGDGTWYKVEDNDAE